MSLRKKIGRNKYSNKITKVDGISFHSIRESKRYRDLKLLNDAGHISHLSLQPIFHIEINGRKICKYIADFHYIDASGKEIFEDVKGMKTPVYRLKKKLVEAVHNVVITEIV